MKQIFQYLKSIISGLSAGHRDQITSVTKWEEKELSNLFILLLNGPTSGIPIIPAFLAAELIPLLSYEITVFNNRAENSSDTLAELTGILDID